MPLLPPHLPPHLPLAPRSSCTCLYCNPSPPGLQRNTSPANIMRHLVTKGFLQDVSWPGRSA